MFRRPPPAPLAAAVAALLLVGCTSEDGDAGSPATTEASTRTTDDTRTPRTTPLEVPGLDCGTLAAEGPPAAEGPATVPDGAVSYERGRAVVLLTGGDEGGEQECLDLQLATGPEDEHLLTADGGRLDLRWADGSTLALQLSLRPSSLGLGVVDGTTRVEVPTRAWADAGDPGCEVVLTGLDGTSVDGTVTCDALAPEGGGEPVAVLAAFHAEA